MDFLDWHVLKGGVESWRLQIGVES